MRIYISSIVGILVTSVALGQQVGINKVSPEHTLDVRSTNNDFPAGLNISNQNKSRYVRFFSGSSMFPDPSMSWAPDKSFLFATFDDNTLAFSEYMRISASGNVGIGTPDPTAKLEVSSAGIGIIANTDCGECSAILGRVSSQGGIGIEGNSSDPNGMGVLGFIAEGDSEGYGVGVRGESKADFGKGMEATGHIGLEAFTASTGGFAVRAGNYSLMGEAIGIQSQTYSPEGTAIFGEATSSSGGVGVRGETQGFMSNGVEGIANSLFGSGVHGRGMTNGVSGEGIRGVNGLSSYNGVAGEGVGVRGVATGTNGQGVRGEGATGIYGQGDQGVEGVSLIAGGIGIRGRANESSSIAIQGEATGSGSSYAGFFLGNVHVTGNLSKSAGSFKIDHPLDPENKYLYHSFVESPDMMNIYNGNTITDEDGKAWVKLPEYFQALNMEFRYQLTVIGQFAQAIVSEKIKGNSFLVKTDKPNVEVSWQVTGIRNDAYARENRMPTEVEKEPENKGKYLNVESHGKPGHSSISRIGEQ